MSRRPSDPHRPARVILEIEGGRIERRPGQRLYVRDKGIVDCTEVELLDDIDLGAGWRPVLGLTHVPPEP